jgi:hypothetical protein
MSRQATDIQGIAQAFSLTTNQIYKLVRRPVDPLPHKKIGRVLRFDLERAWNWFDRQPGKDSEEIDL